MSKIVDFTLCRLCRFYKTDEAKDPCHECMQTPARDDGSKRPIRYWPRTDGAEIRNKNKVSNERR